MTYSETSKHYCERLKACYAHLKKLKGVNLSEQGVDLMGILTTYTELMRLTNPVTLQDQIKWSSLVYQAERMLEAEQFEFVNGHAWNKKEVKAFLNAWSIGFAYCFTIFGKDMYHYCQRFNLTSCYHSKVTNEARLRAWHRFVEYAQAYGEYEAAQRILDKWFNPITA